MRRETLAHLISLLVLVLSFLYVFSEVRPVGQDLGQGVPCKEDTRKALHERISECPIPANERASFKGQEIAKIGAVARTEREGLEIEIVETNAIEGGVEVFARAWTGSNPVDVYKHELEKAGDGWIEHIVYSHTIPANTQVGFGDGTVDIERFLIYNPPILVPDPNGSVERTWTDEDTGERRTGRFSEDLQTALLQTITQAVRVKEQKFDGSRIVRGKVGQTTTVARPDADTESSSFDARAEMNNEATWAAARDSSSSETSNDIDNEHSFIVVQNTGSAFNLRRSWFLFDTSVIPDDDSIDSVTITLYGSGRATTDTIGTSADVVAATTASDTGYTASDFGNVSFSSFASIASGSWDTTDGNPNDFSLNASGEANVSKTGTSKFALLTGTDVSNTAPTGTQVLSLGGYYADEAGTTVDPVITIEHSAGAAEDPTTPQSALFGDTAVTGDGVVY